MPIATCLAIITWITENASSIAASAHAKDDEVLEITNLQPFTQIAYIPEGADLTSIKIRRR